ncbi:MAG: MFS transporter [Propionicimonas sp.]
MTTLPVGDSPELATVDPPASTEDTQQTFRNPGAGFLVGLGAASIALMSALLSVGILTLPLQANAIDPQGATTTIAITGVVAGIIALLISPIMGRLSDRTTGRFGRRRPYLVLSAVLVVLGAFLVLQGGSAAMLATGWGVMTLGQIAGFTALGAAIPDQLSPERRGVPSALFGVAGTGGAIFGLFIASLFSPNLTLMIMVPAVLAAICLIAFAAILADKPLDAAERPSMDLSEVFGTFWVNPLKFPGFALAFGSRFAVFCAIAAVNAYMALYLIMGLHIAPADVAGKIFIANLLSGGLALIVATGMGKVSDKVGRRKPFVIAAAIIFTIGLAMVAMATSFEAFLLAIVILGIGQGVYLAVDFALITQVLPDPKNPGKDLGIMNLASSLPNILVPAIAPALLAIGASATNPQNFSAFFAAAAIAGALGAILIVPIKGVK